MNLTSRDRARQVRNNRGVLGNNVARQPLFATNEVISLLSDDEEDVHENNAEADTSNGNDVQVIKLYIILFISLNKYLIYYSY
jgi:uncharacterized membrane protein